MIWEARKVLDTPAPRVYTWNSQAESHPVGAEFIIMGKAEGVPLSEVWSTMKLPQKLKILLAMTCLEKKWLSVSFSHYGNLYYAKDVQPPAGKLLHQGWPVCERFGVCHWSCYRPRLV